MIVPPTPRFSCAMNNEYYEYSDPIHYLDATFLEETYLGIVLKFVFRVVVEL